MTANEIYDRAKRNGVTFECACTGISQTKWDKLMKGATRADKKKVDRIVVKDRPEFSDFVKFYNPYNHFKTATHLIFVHSSIEHFFRIN